MQSRGESIVLKQSAEQVWHCSMVDLLNTGMWLGTCLCCDFLASRSFAAWVTAEIFWQTGDCLSYHTVSWLCVCVEMHIFKWQKWLAAHRVTDSLAEREAAGTLGAISQTDEDGEEANVVPKWLWLKLLQSSHGQPHFEWFITFCPLLLKSVIIIYPSSYPLSVLF